MKASPVTVLWLAAMSILTQPAAADTLVELLFDEGSGSTAVNTGSLGPGTNGALHGPEWVTDTPSGTGFALSFDGFDDHVTVPDTFDYGPAVTLEAWIKPAAVDGQRGVWDDYGSPGALLYVRDGQVQFSLSTTQDPGLGVNLYAGTVIVGAWQHIAGVYDGAQMVVYVNGIQAANVAATSGAIIDNGSLAATVGADQSALLAFDGLIDDVRVHDEALSASQLAGGVMYLLTDGFESGDTSAWSATVP
jgi:hypothetical protein